MFVKKGHEPVRICRPRDDTIDVAVEDGVVTLDGEVPGLGLKRRAGVLAWWFLAAATSSMGSVWRRSKKTTTTERSPMPSAPSSRKTRSSTLTRSAYRRTTRVVTLHGQVSTDSEREAAESDAWWPVAQTSAAKPRAMQRWGQMKRRTLIARHGRMAGYGHGTLDRIS